LSSKFAGVIAAKRESDNEQEKPQKVARAPIVRERAPKARIPPPAATEAPKRGRPNAKRSNPDFVQTTAYIRRDTHRDVKIALLHEGQGGEYSELVEELLSDWLKSRKLKKLAV